MSIIRRATAIVLQCTVLIMPLVGSGFRCDSNAGHASHMGMDMAMDMSDLSMPGMPMPGDGGNGSTESHSDCSFPWSAGECQSMTSCAPNAMTVEQPTVATVILVSHDEPVLRDEGLRSVTRAPEPPPPRA